MLLASIAALWWLTGRISRMQVFTAILVVVFGALTVWFNDERFFKMKTSIVYAIFAGLLGIGLLRGQSWLALLMADYVPMRREGWMILTRRLAAVFAAMAIANEIVWRLDVHRRVGQVRDLRAADRPDGLPLVADHAASALHDRGGVKAGGHACPSQGVAPLAGVATPRTPRVPSADESDGQECGKARGGDGHLGRAQAGEVERRLGAAGGDGVEHHEARIGRP